jgi:ribosome-associated protein
VRARGYPLSEVTNGGEFARGSYSGFVTTLLEAAVSGADEKLSLDTVVLDLRELVDSFDALVVASGRNDRQVRAIAEEIERLIDVALGVKPTHVEGVAAGEWIALDYGDVIVHVFDEAARDYYDLEHLWNAAPAFRSERTA